MSKKTVFVSGHFNVLHPGHLRLLRFARECGDRLVVGVIGDRSAGEAAYVPEELRLESIKSTSWVDEAFLIERPINEFLAKLKPDIIVKGKEHEYAINPEKEVLDSYGGKLVFSSGEVVFSSVDLIRKEVKLFEKSSIEQPLSFLSRHNISPDRLKELLGKFSRNRVCVLGDLIVDEYITCQPLGMSQEEPVVVVTPVDQMTFLGGAGIVAGHAAGLGATVSFISVAGQDDAREFAYAKLTESGVNSYILEDDSRPTTRKQRFRSGGRSLLRVSHLHQDAISRRIQQQVLDRVDSLLDNIDLLVFSDFNYGCLPQELVNEISEKAQQKGIMMAADSQASSQVGDISRFRGMTLITPTEHEARISLRNNEDGLIVLTDRLRQASGAKHVLVKLGEEGLLIHTGNTEGDRWLTDKINALNRAPKDVAGAGDSLLITSALTLACGGNIWEASCLGSLAAGIQVGRIGNTPLQTQDLMEELSF
ncbi:MAG: adenylyltransferase/cytidyltransferase family protein [Leptospiraceae bacterium]|nr:adenylyltransferase/cytidyltransferase family protein [Leptospiraceae bacterium]